MGGGVFFVGKSPDKNPLVREEAGNMIAPGIHVTGKKSIFSALALLSFIVGGGLAVGQAADLPQVLKGPPAAWVQPLPLDLTLSQAKAASSEEGGTYFLLHDEQVKADEQVRFIHFAKRYLTDGAVEDDSQITISVNPAYQTLTFHTLRILRDGEVLDRLPKQEIKLLQRESRLDWNLFDGRLSAVIILDDLRAGDVVEYSYSLAGANPIFGNHFMDATYLEWTEPVETFQYRLLWPSERKLGFKAFRSEIKPEITDIGSGVTEYRWKQRDIPAAFSDGQTPSWYDAWAWLQLSDFQSWGEVARWAVAIYPWPKEIPAELAEEIARLRKIEGRKEQVLAALQYVQDSIRYLGIEVGANSHEPHPVDIVLQRRFGDCKDKALLLSTILRELGVEAHPALVETDVRKVIGDWLPSPLAFNHVIVQVVLDGKSYWIDPTTRKQGGSLDTLYFPDYGWALVIKPETTALTAIQPSGFTEATTEITEYFTFKDFKGEAALRVVSVFSGREADRMRSYIADTRRSEIKRSYVNYYARQFPDIEATEAPKFQDDREKNILIGEENYLIRKLWTSAEKDKKNLMGDFAATTIRGLLQTPDVARRTMPLVLSYPVRAKHVVELSFPRSMNFSSEKEVVEDPGFKFTYEAKAQSDKLTLSYDYETRRDFIEPANVSEYVSRQDAMRDLLGYRVTVPATWVENHQPAAVEKKAEVAVSDETAQRLGGVIVTLFSLIAGFLIVAGIVGFIVWRASLKAPRLIVPPKIPLHHCVVCGVTDDRDVRAEFRVANDGHEYCSEHLPRS